MKSKLNILLCLATCVLIGCGRKTETNEEPLLPAYMNVQSFPDHSTNHAVLTGVLQDVPLTTGYHSVRITAPVIKWYANYAAIVDGNGVTNHIYFGCNDRVTNVVTVTNWIDLLHNHHVETFEGTALRSWIIYQLVERLGGTNVVVDADWGAHTNARVAMFSLGSSNTFNLNNQSNMDQTIRNLNWALEQRRIRGIE